MLQPLDGSAPDWAPDISGITTNTKKGLYYEGPVTAKVNRLHFNLTSMSVASSTTPTPEPSAALAFGVGLLVVGRAVRKKSRSRR